MRSNLLFVVLGSLGLGLGIGFGTGYATGQRVESRRSTEALNAARAAADAHAYRPADELAATVLDDVNRMKAEKAAADAAVSEADPNSPPLKEGDQVVLAVDCVVVSTGFVQGKRIAAAKDAADARPRLAAGTKGKVIHVTTIKGSDKRSVTVSVEGGSTDFVDSSPAVWKRVAK